MKRAYSTTMEMGALFYHCPFNDQGNYGNRKRLRTFSKKMGTGGEKEIEA